MRQGWVALRALVVAAAQRRPGSHPTVPATLGSTNRCKSHSSHMQIHNYRTPCQQAAIRKTQLVHLWPRLVNLALDSSLVESGRPGQHGCLAQLYYPKFRAPMPVNLLLNWLAGSLL